eukprot:Awhi_evm1s4682
MITCIGNSCATWNGGNHFCKFFGCLLISMHLKCSKPRIFKTFTVDFAVLVAF